MQGMPTELADRAMRVRRWLAVAKGDVFASVDFVAGILVGAGAGAAAAVSGQVREGGMGFLVAAAALGVALTALALSVLALTVSFLDETYRRVVSATRGGWEAAMRPYKVVAFVSVGSTLVAMLGMLVWGALPVRGQALLVGVAAWLATWSLVGTMQLAELTFFHGAMRSELLKGMDDAREVLHERREREAGDGGGRGGAAG